MKKNLDKKSGKLLDKKATEKILATEDKIINEGLREVYVDGDGKIPDLTKFEQKKHYWWQSSLSYGVFILAFLTVLSWLFFFWWSDNSGRFTGKNVSIKIEGPLAAVNGQYATYTVAILNQEKTDIYSLDLSLKYPQTFSVATSTPEPFGSDNQEWKIPVLKSGERTEIVLRGITWGDKDSQQSLQASMTFRPANFNADFKAEGILELPISSSAVALTVTGPSKYAGEKADAYTVKIKNNTEQEVKNLQLTADLPPAFTWQSSSPNPDITNVATWQISSLLPQQEKIIVINGAFVEEQMTANQEAQFKLQGKVLTEDYNTLDAQNLITEVLASPLSLQLLVNNSANDQSINFGDTLKLALIYKNEGSKNLEQINLVLKLNSQILDWTSLNDPQKGQITDSQIAWTSGQIKDFASLAPGQQGEIDLNINVKGREAVTSQNLTDFRAEATSAATFRYADDQQSSLSATAKSLVCQINSDASIGAQARYFSAEGKTLGAGPLPPKVGEKTSYVIVWQINNSIHELNNLNFSVVLPEGVNWENNTDLEAGTIGYAPSTRKVTWLINRLPRSVASIKSSFTISVTPTAAQQGKVLLLLPAANFTATDKQTGGQINLNAAALTTDLTFDQAASGKGVVE